MTDEAHEFLTRPIRTLKAIRELQARIKGLEDAMLPSGVRYDKDRVQGTRTDPMAVFAERVDALIGKIDELRLIYFDQLKAVEDDIGKLDNPNERYVLTMRYVHRMRYEDIAESMFYSIRRVYDLHRSGTGKIRAPQRLQ